MPSSRTDPASLSGCGQPSSTCQESQVTISGLEGVGHINTQVHTERSQRVQAGVRQIKPMSGFWCSEVAAGKQDTPVRHLQSTFSTWRAYSSHRGCWGSSVSGLRRLHPPSQSSALPPKSSAICVHATDTLKSMILDRGFQGLPRAP